MEIILKLFAVLLWSHLATAQDDRATDPDNHFIYPPPAGPKFAKDPTVYRSNPAYILGDSHPFEWVTNVSSIDLWLVSEGADAEFFDLACKFIRDTLHTQHLT